MSSSQRTQRTLVLMLGALLLFAAACGEGNATGGEGAPKPTGVTASDATLGDGEEVTLRGTVDDVIAGMVLTLTDATIEQGTVNTEGEVAVIVTEGGADVFESEEVVVTGTLVDVSDGVQELEDLFGTNVDEEMLAFLDGQQVVIASSVDEDV